jgi:Zn-dependent protease
VTLNPLKHIDLIGLVMLLVAGFGWAKPVIINRAALKKPARDDSLIALSGPLSNLLLAVLLVLLLRGVVAVGRLAYHPALDTVVSLLLVNIAINVSLGLFNLLPIPPLDGSHLVWNLLSRGSPASSELYFRYGSYVLLAVVVLERTTGADILPIGRAVNAVVMALLRLVGLG